MESTTFESLGLHSKILSALESAGYHRPTEIQAASIPLALEGKDLMATAQTGTGKTAAFLLPILEKLYQDSLTSDQPEVADQHRRQDDESNGDRRAKRRPRALILSPTRELAQQIEKSAQEYSQNLPISIASVVGGLPIHRQIRDLRKGVDIVVATPGRLLDLLNRREIDLRKIEFFVLDEADRMLDMGFVDDVKDIVRKLNKDRQTYFFSATTSSDVESLSRVLLNKPSRVSVHKKDSVGENIHSRVLFVERSNKRNVVVELIERDCAKRVLVFTSTKSDANVLAAILERKGMKTAAIHSGRNQRERQRTLESFDKGEIQVLVATDVMARGIDVSGITHVINYDLPNDPENFVHRIGRTARAGQDGVAFSLCDLNEVKMLQSIQRFIKQELEIDENHSYHSAFVQTMAQKQDSPFAKRGVRRSSSFGSRMGRR